MRTNICIYCQLPYNGPLIVCPYCGSGIDVEHAVSAANEDRVGDRALSLEDLEEEFELLPRGSDTKPAKVGLGRSGSDKLSPFPSHRIARA